MYMKKQEKHIEAFKNNLKNLYTYERYPELWFETTNNLSEWVNSLIKEKIKVHSDWSEIKRKI